MQQRSYLLLLLPLDFFSPAWLLRLLLPRLALARSLGALLWLLVLLPLLAAGERLMLPLDEDLELRDAIDILLAQLLRGRARVRATTA